MWLFLVHCDNDQDDNGDTDEDDQQVTVAQSTGSEVITELVRANRQLCQFSVAQQSKPQL